MNKNNFTDINNPAKDVHELISFLKNEEQKNPYVYRGQVKEYNAPLVPSIYRKCLAYSDKMIDRNDQLYKYSLKNIGNAFYGDYVRNFLEYVNKKIYGDKPISSKNKIVHDVYVKAIQSSELMFRQHSKRVLYNYIINRLDLIKSILSKEEWQLFSLYKDRWMPLINDYDRRIIRMFGFFKPLGFVLGAAIAQQYGFSSEGLDATKSIDVAGFFATHSSEDYYINTVDEGIGVIYRFPYKNVYTAHDGVFQYDFYSPYSLIDIDDIIEHMVHDDTDINNFYSVFETFYTKEMMEEDIEYKQLKLPGNSNQNSRISRQKAVLLLPDELRKEKEYAELSIIGNKLPLYQYIEDLSLRDGVEKFYFKHSKNSELALNREYLWPREDPLIYLIVWIITAICQRSFSKDNHYIMHRLDLIDAGYNPGEFLTMCQNMAREHSLVIGKDKRIILLE